MGFILNPNLIFQIMLLLVSFDYYGYNMIGYWLIRVVLPVRPSSIEEIMNWTYFPNLRLWIDVELNSDDDIDLVLVLITVVLDEYGWLIVIPLKKACEGKMVRPII